MDVDRRRLLHVIFSSENSSSGLQVSNVSSVYLTFWSRRFPIRFRTSSCPLRAADRRRCYTVAARASTLRHVVCGPQMSNISFVCPYCRAAPMKGPEQLCQHMEEYHEARNLMEETEFATGEELEHWLNRIEEGRSEGGVLGSDEEKAEDDTQFYILCHRKSTPQPKRRRLETEDTESNESVISCTAFVHILEKMDGSYHVTYCLEHCGTCDCAESSHEDTRYHKKNNHVQKRGHEDSDDGPSSSSGSSLGSSGQGSLSRRQDAFDLSSMNKFLNHRIDTAANSLKAINQMISEMAMDISNRFWDSPQQPIVPVHFHPNEIYSS